MLSKLYKSLWSRVGGRPWTYISRDVWHKYELIPIVVIGLISGVCAHFFGLKMLLIGLGIISVGYVLGHFFWGRPYIPNQKGD